MIKIIFTILLLITSTVCCQNYYEKLGDFDIELKGVPKEGSFHIEYNVYDLDKNKIESNFFNNNFGGYNNYEMKKFVIDKANIIEAIFILLVNQGAGNIWGDLYCITLKKIQNFQTLYVASIEDFNLMYNKTHLKKI